MAFLLDSHTILWFAEGSDSLGATAKETLLTAGDGALYFSVASFWELSIKESIGKLQLTVPLQQIHEELLQAGTKVLPIKVEHTLAIQQLPHHHRDPFDRLLIAQTRHESLTLISKDAIFDQYGIKRIW